MPLYWDSQDLFWDSGLTWDAGDGPNLGSVQPYLDKVTSEHNKQPDFMEMLAEYLQPLADGKAVMDAMVAMFDVDSALGQQLDMIGLWVGASRELSIPITGVFFTFDDGPGFDKGILRGPFDSTDTLYVLPDEQYRTLIKATIAANHWDGTIIGAYEAYAIVFGPGGYRMGIIDHQDMTMTVVLGGPPPDALTLALLLGGYLNLKPVGVRVDSYVVSANANAKIFAFDADPASPIFGGFDEAAFPTFYEGT